MCKIPPPSPPVAERPVKPKLLPARPPATTGCPQPHRHVYTNSASTVLGMDPSVVMEVVVIAEFMVLPSLTSACQSELCNYVDEDSAPQLARFADRYRLLKLESLCQEVLLPTSAKATKQ